MLSVHVCKRISLVPFQVQGRCRAHLPWAFCCGSEILQCGALQPSYWGVGVGEGGQGV